MIRLALDTRNLKLVITTVWALTWVLGVALIILLLLIGPYTWQAGAIWLVMWKSMTPIIVDLGATWSKSAPRRRRLP